MSETAGAADDTSFSVMSGAPLWIAGVVLALANFMVVLDTTIANVSVPNIAGGLAVSPSQGTWVITSYSVAEAITVPLTGWLAQRFGAVRVFVIAVAGFGVCSMLCGFAPSFGAMVGLRVLQGLSGGPIMPLSQTLLRRIFPPRQQAMAIGLWSMTTVVGPVAGPLLGGQLVDGPGWPYIFFINIPVAVLCAVVAWRFLASHETHTERNPVDFTGLGLLILWVGAMQIMLDKGKDLDWFNSPFIVSLAIVAAVGFAAFLIWELTDRHPIVDIKVFRHRGFATATLIMALAFGAFFSSIVLMPLWLQTNLGYNATWAGRAVAPQGIFAVLLSPVVARMSTRVDTRLLVSFGVSLLAVTSFWRAGFAPDIDFFQVSLPQVLQGAAVPFFFIPITGLALGSVLPRETASAAGLMNFTRTTAAAFGTSITTTAWQNYASIHRTTLVGSLNGPQATLDTLTAGGMSAGQALHQLDLMTDGQAVMLATDHVFLVCAGVFVIGASAVWLAPRMRLSGGPAAAGGH
ncbi:MAG TPA: DHA2 family efflux MFS transporter permease subunit [Caulobacteraceae bacterium]|jgi:DHA2 family multidrug resistance protein|nr:DHA2 family efflux MFS transporter permease subunit [Caulobacteraceae bacterium]